jgi:TRAP-type uncharacterized transport system substrate-binding protein
MTPPEPIVHSRSRRRAWLAAALALAAFALALSLLIGSRSPVAKQITVTAGYQMTTRVVVARALAFELQERGIRADFVTTGSTADELARVNSGEVDFALVSGGFRHHGFPHVREVAPLFPEALHLLVKSELEDGDWHGLGGLRGRRVDLGPTDSATASLAAAVLEFAGVACAPEPTPNACISINLELDELERRIESGARDELPDAIFHLASVPSLVAMKLVRRHDYSVVGLPFSRAFRLSEMINDISKPASAGQVERRYTEAVEIAEYSYQIDPPVPATALETVGARLLLVANAGVSASTVEAVLDAVYESRFARIPQPPLSRALLELPPRHPLHEGALAFVARDRPLISGSDADRLANAFSILGALVGGGLFLWQSFRSRVSARRDELFGHYQLQIAALEGRIVELELAADLALDPLITLQREILRLKSEALARYAAGELGNRATLTDLLVPLNAARDHVATLLLHVRENVEQRAESEGREAQAVWEEAVERSEESASES